MQRKSTQRAFVGVKIEDSVTLCNKQAKRNKAANKNNPLGTVCSDSYNPPNYMTTKTEKFADYAIYINSYTPVGGTSAGAGLNNAINHLINVESNDDAIKY